MSDTVTTAPHIREALASAHDQLRHAGTWWDAAQLGAIARRARDGFVQRQLPPWLRELPATVDGLPAAAVEVIDRVTSDPGSVEREWAEARIADLGDAPYVELVGITAVAVIIHMYADCAGEDPEPLGAPAAQPGEPTRERPDGMGDIGAYVAMTDPYLFANVSRALSLVPSANTAFYTVARPMYSDNGFFDLVWSSPLSRPQVELVASKVAAMNECFY